MLSGFFALGSRPFFPHNKLMTRTSVCLRYSDRMVIPMILGSALGLVTDEIQILRAC